MIIILKLTISIIKGNYKRTDYNINIRKISKDEKGIINNHTKYIKSIKMNQSNDNDDNYTKYNQKIKMKRLNNDNTYEFNQTENISKQKKTFNQIYIKNIVLKII